MPEDRITVGILAVGVLQESGLGKPGGVVVSKGVVTANPTQGRHLGQIPVHPFHCFHNSAPAPHFGPVWLGTVDSVADGPDVFVYHIAAVKKVQHCPESSV